MRITIRFWGLFLFLSTCGQRDVLVDNGWILIGGIYHRNQIEFRSTNQIILSDKYGHPILHLNFSEDETIILPGINSPNLRARWTTDGNKISFIITSSESKEFEEAIRVYGQPFQYYISRDTLRLYSEDAMLLAVRDRTIENLFKNFK